MRLTTDRHDRDNAGLTYVYPVVSRRSRGVSVGINLNPNNACNWRCVYCQVPELKSGKGPTIDLALLREELFEFLEGVVEGDYMERHVPEGSRRLNDIAFSGNGEPTSSPQFAESVELALEALAHFELTPKVKPILITNGSLVRSPGVLEALRRLGTAGGNIWFKLDRGTGEGLSAANSQPIDVERHFENLRLAAAACPTWIQTCMFARNGEQPTEAELEAYLALVERSGNFEVPPLGVLLYGLERKSFQPEAPELSRLSEDWLNELGRRIEARGLTARVHP